MKLDIVQPNSLPASTPRGPDHEAQRVQMGSGGDKHLALRESDATVCQEQNTGGSKRVGGVLLPLSNTGGNSTHTPTNYSRYSRKTITVDYLSTTFDITGYGKVISLLRKHFGNDTSTDERSRIYNYRTHISFDDHPTVVIHKNPCCEKGTELFTVVVPGGPLNELDATERYELVTGLIGNVHRTNTPRIDLAVDVRCETGVGLIKDLRQSMRRREIARIKTFGDHFSYDGKGRITGHTFSMGKRGKQGSGKYIRVYDKGLETETLPRGQWERFEVEFTDDVACQVSQELWDTKDFERTAFDLVCGTLNIVKRPSTTSLDVARSRLKPSPYWKAFCAGTTPLYKRAIKEMKPIENSIDYLIEIVLPQLDKAAKANGVTLFEWLRVAAGPNGENIRKTRSKPTDQARAKEFKKWLDAQEDPRIAS